MSFQFYSLHNPFWENISLLPFSHRETLAVRKRLGALVNIKQKLPRMIWRIKFSWQHCNCFNGPYFSHRVTWREPVEVIWVRHSAQSLGSCGCSACADWTCRGRSHSLSRQPLPMWHYFCWLFFPLSSPIGISLIAVCDLCLKSIAVHFWGVSGSGFWSCCRWWKQPRRNINWYSLSATNWRASLG